MDHALRAALRISPLLLVSLASASAIADSMFPEWSTSEPPPPPPPPPSPAPTPEPPKVRAPDLPAPRFGEFGEVVVSGDAIGSIGSTTLEGSQARQFRASFGPGVDFFVARRVSLGLDAHANDSIVRSYGADGSLVDTKSWRIGVGARIGVLVPLGALFSWWPRLTIGLASSHQDESLVSGASLSVANSVGAASTKKVGPYVEVYAPILFHAARHFFFGFGPSVDHDFAHAITVGAATTASAQTTTLGASLTLGGFFGGPSPYSGAPWPSDATLARARFGERGSIAFTNELGIGGAYATYEGTPSWSGSVGAVLGLDYFVGERLSIGGAIAGTYAAGTGLQPDGSTVESRSRYLGFMPRLGLEIPLGDDVSLWPRLGVSLGLTHQAAMAPVGTNQYDLTTITVSVDAPVLVHLAQHFFVGIGPRASHDLSGSVGRGGDLRATTIGVGGYLGGWI